MNKLTIVSPRMGGEKDEDIHNWDFGRLQKMEGTQEEDIFDNGRIVSPSAKQVGTAASKSKNRNSGAMRASSANEKPAGGGVPHHSMISFCFKARTIFVKD